MPSSKVAFAIDSTSGLFFVPPLIKTPFNWGVSAMPQTPPNNNSILYGANVGIFKTTPEKQLASWLFVKYFASKEATAAWAVASNYFPVRKSAETVPAFKAVLDKNPQYKMAFDLFKGGTKMVGEPNLAGQQDARVFIEDPDDRRPDRQDRHRRGHQGSPGRRQQEDQRSLPEQGPVAERRRRPSACHQPRHTQKAGHGDRRDPPFIAPRAEP